MKLKRGLVVTIISIIILTISTNSFAMSLRDKMREDAKKSSNSVSNSVTNEVSNSTENKVTNSVSNKVENKTNDKVEEDDKVVSSSKKEITNKDISVLEPTNDVEYENIAVNGNVFIACTKSIRLEDVEINGDVMLFAENVEIRDSEIAGSVYVASRVDTNIKNSQILSLYSVSGEETTIDLSTEIVRDLKVIGSRIVFNGEVGRDFNAVGGKIEIQDRARIDGKAYVRTEERDISKKAYIGELDYEEITYTKDTTESNTNERVINYLINEGTGLAVILLISIFVLCCFPKFVGVNSSLRLRNFFTDFLLGVVIFIIGLAISIGLFASGYGAGYGLILLNLLFLFVILGKVIFTIAFAIRLCCEPERTSKVKAFFGVVLVALALSAIGMISLAGNVGIIIDGVIDLILLFTGLGSMFTSIFSSTKRYERKPEIRPEPPKPVEPPKPEANVEAIPVTPVAPAPEKDEKSMKDEIKAEIKKELKEEAKREAKKEAKKEEIKKEEPKKVETKKVENQNNNNKPKDEKPKENKPKEDKKPENKDKKNEDNKNKKDQR